MMSSAILLSSSGVRFWIGCGTKSTAGSKPSAFDCAATASVKPVVTTEMPGMPRLSKFMRSCRLHDVQDPQSDSPIRMTLTSDEIFWRFSVVATLALVGLPQR